MAEHYSIAGMVPHIGLLIAAALAGVLVRVRRRAFAAISSCAFAAGLLYWLVQNGMYPYGDIRLGHGLAAFVAASLPAAVTGATSWHGTGVTRIRWLRASLAVLVGAVTLLFVPAFQVFLGCAFSGICL